MIVNADQIQTRFLPKLTPGALLRALTRINQTRREIVDPLRHRHTVLSIDQDALTAFIRQDQDDGIPVYLTPLNVTLKRRMWSRPRVW